MITRNPETKHFKPGLSIRKGNVYLPCHHSQNKNWKRKQSARSVTLTTGHLLFFFSVIAVTYINHKFKILNYCV